MSHTATCPICKKTTEMFFFSSHENVIPWLLLCSKRCSMLFGQRPPPK